jgi:outer membrane biosynthesis protein TonB
MPDEGGGGNVFTRKMGPLPMWGWMGIALALALGYYFIHGKKSSGSTPANDVPQFVNQVYDNDYPPPSPKPKPKPPPKHPKHRHPRPKPKPRPKHPGHKPPAHHPKTGRPVGGSGSGVGVGDHDHDRDDRQEREDSRPMASQQYHGVRTQDSSIEGVAAQYNMNPNDLARFNGMPNTVSYPGQMIRVPVDASTSEDDEDNG